MKTCAFVFLPPGTCERSPDACWVLLVVALLAIGYLVWEGARKK